MKKYATINAKQTQELGEILAGKLQGGKIICMTGELGSGKTTFTQGLLNGLGAKGPYTSPTFVVMKEYKLATRNSQLATKKKFQVSSFKFQRIYHIDAYRVNSKDILNLGWDEIIENPKNIVIIEWAENIREIIPEDCLRIEFRWIDENKREINFKDK